MPALDNAQHEDFCQRYRLSFNATEAATGAGYSARTARSQGSRLLTNVDIQGRLRELAEAASDRNDVTEDRVIEELRRIAFLDVRELFEWDEGRAAYVPSGDLSAEVVAAVQSVKAKTTTRSVGEATETTVELDLKTYDKLAAIDKLARHLGMFTDKLDVTSKGEAVKTTAFPPPPR